MAARKNSDGNAEAPVTRRIAGRGSAARAAAKKTARRRKSAAKKVARKSRAAPNEYDNGSNGAGSALVIVESPAKAKTISKYLGRGYRVRATIGHVRDLPEKKLGIDLEKNFAPEYVTIAGKEKTLAELKSAAKESSAVYIATDPGCEWTAASASPASAPAGRARGRGPRGARSPARGAPPAGLRGPPPPPIVGSSGSRIPSNSSR